MLVSQVINVEREASRNVLRPTFLPVALMALSLLPHFFFAFTSVSRLCLRADVCARRLFPRLSSTGRGRARGDSDREIVGIRGVTRGLIWFLRAMDRSRLRSSSQLG